MELKLEINKSSHLWNKYYLEILFNSKLCWEKWKIFKNKFQIINLDKILTQSDIVEKTQEINLSTEYYWTCKECNNLNLCLEENISLVQWYIEQQLSKKNKNLMNKEDKKNYGSWYTTFQGLYIERVKKKIQKTFLNKKAS